MIFLGLNNYLKIMEIVFPLTLSWDESSQKFGAHLEKVDLFHNFELNN